MIDVFSPLSGSMLALAEVQDPVLSAGIVGWGCAVAPVEERWHEVCAPVAGKLLKVHPHAFIVFTSAGIGILVHLGIDTVGLKGEGFDVLKSEGDHVEVGDTVVRWDSSVAIERGLSTSVSVIACDLPKDLIDLQVHNREELARGDHLYSVITPGEGS